MLYKAPIGPPRTAGEPWEDVDEDGLPDHWEREHFGNLRKWPFQDRDRDGYMNIEEWMNGTDPKRRERRDRLHHHRERR